YDQLGTVGNLGRIGKIEHLFSKLEDDRIEELKAAYSGNQASRNKENSGMEEQQQEEKKDIAQDFADKVALTVAKIVEVERHPKGEFLYILQVDTGAQEPTQIVSSIVPYYKEEELLGQHIILVQNLKPANFRSVKSRGMLLAASDPAAPEHTTCEVLFAPQFEVGTQLLPQGTEMPESRKQLKADVFFDFNLVSEDGVVKIDGRPIGSGGQLLTAKVYLNGEIG
ncbi:MAG: methionine--tRNA ligase, partial [Sphaerochaetaceae bacterium]|nr:methionine--tRNA ligase [Sphaerochaetaceae bacterium]